MNLSKLFIAFIFKRVSLFSIAISYNWNGLGDVPCSDGSFGSGYAVCVCEIDVARPIIKAIDFYAIDFKEKPNVVVFSFMCGVDGARFSAIFTS